MVSRHSLFVAEKAFVIHWRLKLLDYLREVLIAYVIPLLADTIQLPSCGCDFEGYIDEYDRRGDAAVVSNCAKAVALRA